MFKYTYKVYEHSPKATKYSKILGVLTCIAMYMVYVVLWLFALATIFAALGLSEDLMYILLVVSLIGLYVLVRKIKLKLQAKIERIALNDLKRN